MSHDLIEVDKAKECLRRAVTLTQPSNLLDRASTTLTKLRVKSTDLAEVYQLIGRALLRNSDDDEARSASLLSLGKALRFCAASIYNPAHLTSNDLSKVAGLKNRTLRCLACVHVPKVDWQAAGIDLILDCDSF